MIYSYIIYSTKYFNTCSFFFFAINILKTNPGSLQFCFKVSLIKLHQILHALQQFHKYRKAISFNLRNTFLSLHEVSLGYWSSVVKCLAHTLFPNKSYMVILWKGPKGTSYNSSVEISHLNTIKTKIHPIPNPNTRCQYLSWIILINIKVGEAATCIPHLASSLEKL